MREQREVVANSKAELVLCIGDGHHTELHEVVAASAGTDLYPRAILQVLHHGDGVELSAFQNGVIHALLMHRMTETRVLHQQAFV